MTENQDIALRVQGPTKDTAVGGLARADELWSQEHREALARYLGVEPNNPALYPMLAVCAAWGLDPFAGQVWLLKQKGRDASGAERWRPAAGRDGYLAIANRQPDYRGITGDVVREHDTFAVEWETDDLGMRPLVSHSYKQGPTGNGNERHARGGILGAWAVLFRNGRLPVYYFAPWQEHMRDPDKSAWSYKSAMILKAAQSMALRLGYSITGLVPSDELAVGFDTPEEIAQVPTERPWQDDDLPFGDDELGLRIREAVRLSWESGSREWTRARLAMLLGNPDEESRRMLAKQIEGSLPVPEEDPEEVVDAEPVEEDPGPPEYDPAAMAQGDDEEPSIGTAP